MRKIFDYSFFVFSLVFLSIILPSVFAAPVSIMPLGDSITHGTASGAKPGEEVSYRKALRDKLVAAGYEIVFVGSQKSESPTAADLHHEGHSGWCAAGCYQNRSDILREVDKFLANTPPDVVLLHIGTNDIASHHRPEETVSAVNGILDKIFRYGREQKRQIWVILALIVSGQNPPCIYCQQITAYNRALRQMAQARIQKGDKIILVDMENGAGIDYRGVPEGDMWDFGHPYETGYQKMAAVWFEGLKQILTPSRNFLYQELRANRKGSMGYFEGEKADPPPIEIAPPSVPPFGSISTPTKPTQAPAGSTIADAKSTAAAAKETKVASQKEAVFEKKDDHPREGKGYVIQINAFRDLHNAEEFVKSQKMQGFEVYFHGTQIKDQGIWYRIYLGHFVERNEAARYMKEKKIKEKYPACFIQKLP